MATYKSGYKKQTAEQALLKIIVGIIIATFTFVIAAFVINTMTEWRKYDYYTTLDDYDTVLDNGDGNYVVYLYSPSCTHCADIKTKVLRIGHKLNKDSEMFYLADTSSMQSSDDNANDEDEFLTATGQVNLVTPTLVVMVGGEFYQVYTGETDVVSTLQQIEDGTYAPFN